MKRFSTKILTAFSLALFFLFAFVSCDFLDDSTDDENSSNSSTSSSTTDDVNTDIGTETDIDPFSGTTWLTYNEGNFYFSTTKTVKWGSKNSSVSYAYRVTYNNGSYIANIYKVGSSRSWEYRLTISSTSATIAIRQFHTTDEHIYTYDEYCTKDTPEAYATIIGTTTSADPFSGTTWTKNNGSNYGFTGFYFSTTKTVKRQQNSSIEWLYRVTYNNGSYIATMYNHKDLIGTKYWIWRLIISSANATTAVCQTRAGTEGYAVTYIPLYTKQ